MIELIFNHLLAKGLSQKMKTSLRLLKHREDIGWILLLLLALALHLKFFSEKYRKFLNFRQPTKIGAAVGTEPGVLDIIIFFSYFLPFIQTTLMGMKKQLLKR